MNTKNVSGLSQLIDHDYSDAGKTKIDILADMIRKFDTFDSIAMHSIDRHIQLMDNDRTALCRQTYRLEVMADGKTHQMLQKEALELTKHSHQWFITAGL